MHASEKPCSLACWRAALDAGDHRRLSRLLAAAPDSTHPWEREARDRLSRLLRLEPFELILAVATLIGTLSALALTP